MALLELAQRENSPEALQGLADRMRQYTDHALYLADKFLELSRLEASEALSLVPIDLLDVVDSAIDQVWSQAKLKSINI